MIARPCLSCGELTTASRCDDCRPVADRLSARVLPRTSPRTRGYDTAWDNLSARARRLQPFCILCGDPTDLTTDHLPEAWERKARGQTIRLCDVRVLCRGCNTAAGTSRPGEGDLPDEARDHRGQAKSRSHTRPWVEGSR